MAMLDWHGGNPYLGQYQPQTIVNSLKGATDFRPFFVFEHHDVTMGIDPATRFERLKMGGVTTMRTPGFKQQDIDISSGIPSGNLT